MPPSTLDSPAGQDRVVASLLAFAANDSTAATRGTFVDLAANDAVHNSNTYVLEQLLVWPIQLLGGLTDEAGLQRGGGGV